MGLRPTIFTKGEKWISVDPPNPGGRPRILVVCFDDSTHDRNFVGHVYESNFIPVNVLLVY